MAEPSAAPVVDSILKEAGIRPFSLVGGARLETLLFKAIELDRARRDSPGESLHVEGDWAFDFDEQSGDDAWWVELQLFDHADTDLHIRHVVATLSLSDVELEGLIRAATEIIAEGRNRFS